jgi:hypothetical protein
MNPYINPKLKRDGMSSGGFWVCQWNEYMTSLLNHITSVAWDLPRLPCKVIIHQPLRSSQIEA